MIPRVCGAVLLCAALWAQGNHSTPAAAPKKLDAFAPLIPGFWDVYGAHLVQKLTASGAGPAAIQAKLQEVRRYKELYKNPFLNAALTFIHPFPIGLVMTLISALVLRRRPQPLPGQSPLPAS